MLGNICRLVRGLVQNESEDLPEEFDVHLINLKAAEILLLDKIRLASMYVNEDEYKISYLIPLRKKIRKIDLKLKIFKILGKNILKILIKINNNYIFLAFLAYYLNFWLMFINNILCIHSHLNNDYNCLNILSIIGYIISIIILFFCLAITPYNHFDFLKYFTFKFNIYYIYIAYLSILGFLLIIVQMISNSYEIVLNFHNNLIYIHNLG